MKKKLLVACLSLFTLSNILDARGGGGHGGGHRGGGHGGGHRGGGHGGGHRSGHGGHRYGHGGHYGGRGYGHGGWGYGGWGGWGWGLGLGLGFGLAANSWYTAPGYYGGTYIDNSTANNYFYDNEAIYDAQSGEKVTDYKNKDRKDGLKKHINKLKKEKEITKDKDKIDALEKRIHELEEGLKA